MAAQQHQIGSLTMRLNPRAKAVTTVDDTCHLRQPDLFQRSHKRRKKRLQRVMDHLL
jgi:hypothetical protein